MINDKISEKLISWLEQICTIRFGNKSKWPKNKKNGLAGLADILFISNNMKSFFKLESIVKFILTHVNKRSCLSALVESSKKVYYFIEEKWKSKSRFKSVVKSSDENKNDVFDEIKNLRNIETKYKLLSEYLNKVHENVESKCSKLKDINLANFYDESVMMLENLYRGTEGIKSRNFLTTFEVNESPDKRNFVSNFMNMLSCLQGIGFQQLPEYFFNSCYALDIKIDGESVTKKTSQTLFPNFYRLINK